MATRGCWRPARSPGSGTLVRNASRVPGSGCAIGVGSEEGDSRIQTDELVDPGCRIGGIARAVPMADYGRRAGGGVATVAPPSPQDQSGDHSMSDTSNPAGRPTRRQFVKRVAGTAVCAIAAPAIVRGRNLNDR